jgi:hypothetical protein
MLLNERRMQKKLSAVGSEQKGFADAVVVERVERHSGE